MAVPICDTCTNLIRFIPKWHRIGYQAGNDRPGCLRIAVLGIMPILQPLDLDEVGCEMSNFRLSHHKDTTEYRIEKFACCLFAAYCTFGNHHVVFFGHAVDGDRGTADERLVFDLLVRRSFAGEVECTGD